MALNIPKLTKNQNKLWNIHKKILFLKKWTALKFAFLWIKFMLLALREIKALFPCLNSEDLMH